jgi:hypothetical protein
LLSFRCDFEADKQQPSKRIDGSNTMGIENPSELSQYAEDLTYAFPDVLGLARGPNQTDPVADAIAFHPIVLGFLNGFGRTMVRVASLKLGLNTEAQALVTYRAIANVMNRFGEMEQFEVAIEELSNNPTDDFLRYQELGVQYLRAASTSGNQAITEQILKLVNQTISTLLDDHGLHPVPKH